jgi:hypothetical protein
MEHKMSTDTKQASTEANASEEQQEQATSINVETQAETSEEQQEAERPGVCCGSCS